MQWYCLDKTPLADGENLLHTTGCIQLPMLDQCLALGYFKTPIEAYRAARPHCKVIKPCLLCLPKFSIKNLEAEEVVARPIPPGK